MPLLGAFANLEPNRIWSDAHHSFAHLFHHHFVMAVGGHNINWYVSHDAWNTPPLGDFTSEEEKKRHLESDLPVEESEFAAVAQGAAENNDKHLTCDVTKEGNVLVLEFYDAGSRGGRSAVHRVTY
ncbi:MAG: hypothetical protein Q9159_002767 [Coniocarpon cinnabarinum]